MDEHATIQNIAWHTDDLGLFWTADLILDGVKAGVVGNYYETDERQLTKSQQLEGFCVMGQTVDKSN